MVLTIPSPTRAITVSSPAPLPPPRPADEPIDIGAHRHAAERMQLDAIFRDGGDAWRLDDLGDDRHLHGRQNVPPGQVVRFEIIEGNIQACLHAADTRGHDGGW